MLQTRDEAVVPCFVFIATHGFPGTRPRTKRMWVVSFATKRARMRTPLDSMSISPMTRFFFGGGVWAPPNDVLTKIRDAIVDNPSNWKKITRSKSFLATFDGVRGDGLKRPPRGYDPEHPLLEDLKRKTYYVMKPGTKDMAQSPAFIDEVTQTFEAASPFMKFVASALELPY